MKQKIMENEIRILINKVKYFDDIIIETKNLNEVSFMDKLVSYIRPSVVHDNWILTNGEIKKLINALGHSEFTVIGSGSNGVAIDVGKMIIKLTTDKSEVSSAKTLIGKNTEHLVRYFSINELEFSKLKTRHPIENMYIISLEKLTPLNNHQIAFIEEVDTILTAKGGRKMVNNQRTYPEYTEFIKFITNMRASGYNPSSEVLNKAHKNIYDQLNGISSECRKFGISDLDMHGGNLGFRGDILVFFDMGGSDTYTKENLNNPTIKL